MEAMIKNDEEKLWMMPLLDFRNELGDFEKEASRRDYRRMNGQVFLGERKSDNSRYLVRGPYRPKWRHHWLRRLLGIQQHIREIGPPEVRNIELISMPELHEIRRIWLHEKHEFDDMVPRIYEGVVGTPFQILDADDKLLDAEDWQVLQEVCGDGDDFFQLQMRMLDIERKYRSMSRRAGIFDDLEGCLKAAQFESEEEAVAIRRDEEDRRRLSTDEKTPDVGPQMTLFNTLDSGAVAERTDP